MSFRQKGTTGWLRLRENIDETQFNWDTSQLPDGTYELRLVATDSADNPVMPLRDSKEGVEFQVDNTPPQVSIQSPAAGALIYAGTGEKAVLCSWIW